MRTATRWPIPWVVLLVPLWSTCDKFELSPYSTDLGDLTGALNAHNAAWLATNEIAADDTISFLLMGDCQRFYEEQEAMVATANSLPGLDFVIMNGDITDFGLLEEFMWVQERMAGLHVPCFYTLGNHDIQANGEVIFAALYGPPNYTVRYKDCLFIFFDSNGREYGNNGSAPDMAWLQTQFMTNTAQRTIAVSHVPPTNPDFDPELVAPYTGLLAQQSTLLASMHSHTGSFADHEPFGDGVRYIVCNTLQNPDMLWVKIAGDDLTLQHVIR